MRTIKYLNGILTVLAILLAMNLWTVWTTSGPALVSPAHAAEPTGMDAGAQRKQIIDLLKLQTQKTDELIELLKSGRVRVVVENAAKSGQ